MPSSSKDTIIIKIERKIIISFNIYSEDEDDEEEYWEYEDEGQSMEELEKLEQLEYLTNSFNAKKLLFKNWKNKALKGMEN